MLTIAWYLLKVLLCSAILFGYYWFVLRNKKFHLYNRFYLLSSIVLSWIIPLIKIDWWEDERQRQVVKLLTVVANGDRYVEEANPAFDWNLVATITFACISGVFMTQLIIAIVKIKNVISKNPIKKWNDIYFVFTNIKGTPFSFFKYIFWNDIISLDSSEGKQILKHELAHVHENHSADKLFLSIALIVSWYNPFIWVIRKELNVIHEFIADQKAVGEGDTHSFAVMLLKTAYPAQSTILTSSFFHSPIKRRLTMLTKIRNPRYSYLRRLMILPLLTVVILFFAFRLKEKKVFEASYKKQESGYLFSDTGKSTPQFPGGSESWKRYLNRNLDATVGTRSGAPAGTYKVTLRFKVDKEGGISNIKALTNNGYGFESEAINLIKKGPKWMPAKKGNVFVSAFVEQDFYFSVPGVTISSKTQNHPDLVILDGKKMNWQEWQKIDMKPEQIMSVNVLQDQPAIDKYGAEGKNGVIEITSALSDKFKTEQQKHLQDQQKYLQDQQKHLIDMQQYNADYQKFIEARKKYNEDLQQYAKYQQKFTEKSFQVEDETPAQFPGGLEEWRKYFFRKTDFKALAKHMAPVGKYTVIVDFVVNKDGSISNVVAKTETGYGTEEEAIRTISKGPKWQPAKKDGLFVDTKVKQTITYTVTKEGWSYVEVNSIIVGNVKTIYLTS